MRDILIIIACLILISILMAHVLPLPVDWSTVFRPAALGLLAGRSPYGGPFFNPPWTLFPLLPIALVPEPYDRGVFFIASLLLLAYTARKLGGGPVAVVIFLISAPVVQSLANGNLEALVLAGVIMPPFVGLFFVSMKPQIGLAIAVFWAWQAWRSGGLRLLVLRFLPITIAVALSLAVFGPWIVPPDMENIYLGWNASLWPWSLPIGAALLVRALRTLRKDIALMSAPFLSPFLTFQSWAASLLGLVNYPVELAAASIVTWALLILPQI